MNGTVSIVDDDPSVREALNSLLRSVGLSVAEYANATDFLASTPPDDAHCIVVDIRMPGLSGLELQQRLIQGPGSPSIVFITAHGDVPMAVRAMKAGALEFLQKPFRDDDLLEAIWNGLRVDAERRAMQQAIDAARQRYELLTAREREVLGQVVAGALNKQIGAALGISEQTVKVHRHHITRKLAAHSVADLMHVHELAHRR